MRLMTMRSGSRHTQSLIWLKRMTSYAQNYSASGKRRSRGAKAPELEEYGAGYLNDYGAGDVGWWHDYIISELGRAYAAGGAKRMSKQHKYDTVTAFFVLAAFFISFSGFAFVNLSADFSQWPAIDRGFVFVCWLVLAAPVFGYRSVDRPKE